MARRSSGGRDALLLVDVLADFGHEDGDRLFAAFREAAPRLVAAIADAHARRLPVIYANDDFGTWSGDRRTVLERARRGSSEPSLIDAVAPGADDAFLCKPRYSAFDHTPLDILLQERGVGRLLLAGTATEMCVTQTAIDAREHGYLVTVLADACASVDADNAALAIRYLEVVVGARTCRVDR